jgi:N6-L-threonylcarbamoyladenine synthase
MHGRPPRGSVLLREMRACDLEAVAAIESASFSDPWSPRMLAEELRQELAWKQVAVTPAGEVVGYLFGRRYPDVWHLMDLAVAEGFRRQGIGRRLVEQFLQAAAEADRAVVLEVRPGNTAALALYSQLGFVQIGVRRGYYRDTGEDALVLEREVRREGGLTVARAHGEEQVKAKSKPLLALESSCDDTAAAVLDPTGKVLSSVVHSQDSIHERYGGVVPEAASRAHVERMSVVVQEALRQAEVWLDDLGGVAVTVGPGLIGALLVGVQTAKTIAWSRRLPLHPVNHLHGHLAAVWLADPEAPFPMVILVASGGHTLLVRADDRCSFRLLGQTLDDAAGEAFDKGARLLGLGYPGGKELDLLAETGDPKAFAFPIGLHRSRRPDFSFSGVKTALYYLLRDMGAEDRKRRAADVAASYRAAVVQALVDKSVQTARRERVRTLGVAGGVAANSLLRLRLRQEGEGLGLHVVVPPLAYCTDNAAMIGAAALAGPALHYPDYLDLDASASLPLGRWLPSDFAPR